MKVVNNGSVNIKNCTLLECYNKNAYSVLEAKKQKQGNIAIMLSCPYKYGKFPFSCGNTKEINKKYIYFTDKAISAPKTMNKNFIN